MDRNEKLMFVGTFIFGMVAGSYLYFVGFEPLGISAPDRSSGTGDSFTVVAEERGVCTDSELGCGSYQLRGNRDYRFVRGDVFGTILDTQEGLLSRNLFDPLVDELNQRYQRGGFEIYPTSPPACADRVGDIRYRVDIADFGVFYVAACYPTVSDDDTLLSTLERISQAFPF